MTTRVKTLRARELRRSMTKHEVKLWVFLRNAQMDGLSFRRQHSIGPYFLDFYCAAAKLAIELDGSQHTTTEAQEYDERRSRFLSRQGVRAVRFWNHELNDSLEGVLEAIRRALTIAPTRPATPGTLPLSGGGRDLNQHH